MNEMKRFLLLVLIVAGISFEGNTQPPTYDDLIIYYADQDYDKLLRKAEKYTQSDKTKKDALPYLYLAKCNFEMSKDQKWLDKYPKAFNDAIKYAGNCRKRDERAGTTVYADNVAFFTDLKTAIVEDMKNLIAEESFMRLQGYIAKLHRFNKEDLGSYFLKSGAMYMEKDNSGGRVAQKEAWEKLEETTSVDSWRPIDFEMLRIGVIVYCDSWINMKRQKQEATKILGKVKQWLEDDEQFMDYYNKVMFG